MAPALLSFLGNMVGKISSNLLPAVGALFSHGWKGFKGAFQSMSDATTGAHLTGAQNEANAFTAQQAQNAMDFEMEMSNTSYQRGVADMKAAGLNPAMMYGGSASGASTPSGQMSSSASPSSPDVVGLMTALSNLSLLKAQRDNIKADTENKRQQVKESEERINEIRATTNKIVADTDIAIENLRKIGLEGDALEIANRYLAQEKQLALDIGAMKLDEIEANVAEINKRIEKLDADKMAVLQSIAESAQRVNLLLAQESLTEAQKSEVFALIGKINTEKDNLVKSGKLLEKDINWYTHDKIAGDVSSVVSGVTGFLGIGKIGKLLKKGNSSKVVGASPYDEYADYLN